LRNGSRLQKRGGQGIITIRTSERNGPVIGVAQVTDEAELMLITDGGKVLRCPAAGISTMGRATQGVRMMNLAEGENLVAISRLADSDDGVGDETAEAVDDTAVDDADTQEPDGTDDAEA